MTTKRKKIDDVVLTRDLIKRNDRWIQFLKSLSSEYYPLIWEKEYKPKRQKRWIVVIDKYQTLLSQLWE